MRYARNVDRQRGQESASANPYRLDVFTASIRDVVADAGGWIVDRVLAGWIVTVITDAGDDAERAGKILGCEVSIRGATTDSLRPCPYGIALTPALYGIDSQLQKCIADALEYETIEISLVGGRLNGRCDSRLRPITHRLSAAAQAFKAHALAAAGLPNSSVTATERLLGAVLAERDSVAREKRIAERVRGTAQDLRPDDGAAASSP